MHTILNFPAISYELLQTDLVNWVTYWGSLMYRHSLELSLEQ